GQSKVDSDSRKDALHMPFVKYESYRRRLPLLSPLLYPEDVFFFHPPFLPLVGRQRRVQKLHYFLVGSKIFLKKLGTAKLLFLSLPSSLLSIFPIFRFDRPYPQDAHRIFFDRFHPSLVPWNLNPFQLRIENLLHLKSQNQLPHISTASKK